MPEIRDLEDIHGCTEQLRQVGNIPAFHLTLDDLEREVINGPSKGKAGIIAEWC